MSASTRYATAYFNVAQELGALRSTSADLETLKPLWSKYSSVFTRLDYPNLSPRDRLLFVRKVFMATKLHKITKNLLSMLAEYGCLELLGHIINAYEALSLNFQKKLLCDVVSVKKLPAAELERIRSFLEKEFKYKIMISNSIDASILGGLLIKTRAFVLDGSTATRLKQLELNMQNQTNAVEQ